MGSLNKYLHKLALFVTFIKSKKKRFDFIRTASWFSPLEITLPPRVKSHSDLLSTYSMFWIIAGWQHIDLKEIYALLSRIDYNLISLNYVLVNNLNCKHALCLILQIQKDFEILFFLLYKVELKLYSLAAKKNLFINMRKTHTDQWMHGEVFDSFDRRRYRFHDCLRYAYFEQYLSRDMYMIWADEYLDCRDYNFAAPICKFMCNWTRDSRELYFIELDDDEWNAHFYRYVFANNLSHFSAAHSCGILTLFMWELSFEITMAIDLNNLHKLKELFYFKEFQFYQICLKSLDVYKKDGSRITQFFFKIFIFCCCNFKYFRVFMSFFCTCWTFQYCIFESCFFKQLYYFFVLFIGLLLYCILQIKKILVIFATFLIQLNDTMLTKKEFFLTFVIVPFASFFIKLLFVITYRFLYFYIKALEHYCGIQLDFFQKTSTKLIIYTVLYYIINLCLNDFLTC